MVTFEIIKENIKYKIRITHGNSKEFGLSKGYNTKQIALESARAFIKAIQSNEALIRCPGYSPEFYKRSKHLKHHVV